MDPFLTDIASDGVWASTMEPSLTESVREGCRESASGVPGASSSSASRATSSGNVRESNTTLEAALLFDPTRSEKVVDGCFFLLLGSSDPSVIARDSALPESVFEPGLDVGGEFIVSDKETELWGEETWVQRGVVA